MGDWFANVPVAEASIFPKSTTNGLTARDMVRIADKAAGNANLYASRALAKADVSSVRMFADIMRKHAKKAQEAAHKTNVELGHQVLAKEELPYEALLASAIARPELTL